MTPAFETSPGCGSSSCQCASAALPELASPAVARINGVALLAPDEVLALDAVRERAYTELLRQEAVRLGHLPAQAVTLAPELQASDRQAIEAMIDAAIPAQEPSDQACQRFYDSHKAHYVVGQALHLRHILFAVTPGVDVHALAQRAEGALLELTQQEVPPQHFEALARELSNCPSGADGGDLGWIGPQDCAPELAHELFFQNPAGWGMGVHPQLVHTRYGFHIMEVLGRRQGQQQGFELLRERIAMELLSQARTNALRQYMWQLVEQANVQGVELEGADSPLAQ